MFPFTKRLNSRKDSIGKSSNPKTPPHSPMPRMSRKNRQSSQESLSSVQSSHTQDIQFTPDITFTPVLSLETYVGMALGITSQEWSLLGMGTDPNDVTTASKDLSVIVDRVTALMLVRILAWITPRGQFSDLSTTTICRQILYTNNNNADDNEKWSLSNDLMVQTKEFVQEMLSQYKKVPYHNVEHAYHVIISTNKLIDMVLLQHQQVQHPEQQKQQLQQPPPPEPKTTYGFKDDALMQFSLLFAAMIHDVEHQGIPNRQLANENDVLAITYNDSSVAEHRSLTICFQELLRPKYNTLRSIIFPEVQDYRRFRQSVVTLVLSTDIANPERTQIWKSKWKEAFGEPYETVERKIRKQIQRQSVSSAVTSISRRPTAASRRMSTQSVMSELTLEVNPNNLNGGAPVIVFQSNSGNNSSGQIATNSPSNNDLGEGEGEDGIDDEDDESMSSTPDSSVTDGEVEVAPFTNSVSSPTSAVVGGPAHPIRPPRFRPPTAVSSYRSEPGSPTDTSLLQSGPSATNSGSISNLNPPLTPVRKLRLLSKGQSNRDGDLASISSGPSSFMHGGNSIMMKFQRRLSAITSNSTSNIHTGQNHRRFVRSQRLGLLHTVDLSGESIQIYKPMQPRPSATLTSIASAKSLITIPRSMFVGTTRPTTDSTDNNATTTTAAAAVAPLNNLDPPEEIDELRESVIMEQILKAADVAHNLQGWDLMVKFSNRLFLELRRAYVQNRGDDPQNGWFTNQIGFLECYLLPLARRLDDMGVFGDEVGAQFANNVEMNRDRWTRDGMKVTAGIVSRGEKKFPHPDDLNEHDDEDKDDDDDDNDNADDDHVDEFY